MMGKKMNVIFNLIISLFFLVICLLFFINATSGYLSLNIIAYYWPLLFLLGMAFGVYIMIKNSSKNLMNSILAIIVVCICISSLGLYLFYLFLGKVMGG